MQNLHQCYLAVGLEPPEGGLILAGHTTADMGSFSHVEALHGLTVSHQAIAVPVHQA